MGHGDLSMEAYTQVWEECYGQVRTLNCIKTSPNLILQEPGSNIVSYSLFTGVISTWPEQVHESQPGIKERPH